MTYFIPESPRSRLAKIPGALDALRRIADRHLATMDEVLGRGREKHIAHARAEFVHVLRSGTGLSFPAIGRLVDRDHTTIMQADAIHAERVARELASS